MTSVRRQRDALGLAARKLRCVRIEQLGETEAIRDRVRLPAGADDVADGAGRQRSRLVQERDAHAAAAPDDAGFGVLRTEQHPQQGRLAAAVETDDAQTVTRRDRDRQVREKRSPGPAHRDVTGVDQDHHRASYRGGPGVPAVKGQQ